MTAVIICFHCDVATSSSAARLRGEACGVARPRPAQRRRSSSARVDDVTLYRGNVIGLTSIIDRGQFFYS